MGHVYKNLTLDNIDDSPICCFVHAKQEMLGINKKKAWLKDRLNEGHVYRELVNGDKTAFIEYAPLEKAWTPIEGDNYLYIYCLRTVDDSRGKSIQKELLDYAISDAKKMGKSGLCVLTHETKKTWLSDGSFFILQGFEVVDVALDGYQLLALSFNKKYPRFSLKAKKGTINNNDLVIYYSYQCPYIPRSVETIKEYCEKYDIPLTLKKVDTLAKAKHLPCVFNNYALFYKGKFVTVNLLDIVYLERLILLANKKS